jgi:agmatinase
VRRIGREVDLVGMEIVEVAPPYDHADVTAMLANRVVLETLSGIARRRADAASGTRWDEATPLLAGRVPTSDPAGNGAASEEIASVAIAVAAAQANAELVAEDRDHERAL